MYTGYQELKHYVVDELQQHLIPKFNNFTTNNKSNLALWSLEMSPTSGNVLYSLWMERFRKVLNEVAGSDKSAKNTKFNKLLWDEIMTKIERRKKLKDKYRENAIDLLTVAASPTAKEMETLFTSTGTSTQQERQLEEEEEEEDQQQQEQQFSNLKVPRQDDRYIINGTDISLMFYEFQKHVKSTVDNTRLCYETHVHHLLAMSSILLLRPQCIDQDLKLFMDNRIRKSLIEKLQKDLNLECKTFNKDLKDRIEDIINNVRLHKITKKKGVSEIFSLDDQATAHEKKVISSLGAMVMKLPDEYLMNDAKEMQLITRYLDPALESLFDDFDNDIMFKWSNTINQEAKTATNISISKRRPDACIDYLQGVYFHKTYGFGEVKCRIDAQINHGLSKDLIRLGVFSKNAIDHGKLKGVLSFQAIGNHVTFYITKLVSDGLYIMLEIGHIQTPRSLYELVSYLSHLGDVLNVVHAFHDECGDADSTEERTTIESRERTTTSTPEMTRVLEVTRSNKRPCVTSYYY